MNEDIKKGKKLKINSNLDVVDPGMDNLGNFPIFSQPVLHPDLEDARIQDKLNALDLSLGIPNKKKFINHGQLDAKGRRARREEVENEDEEDQIDEENQEAPFSAVMSKNLVSRDPGLDFMDPERRERLTQYYLIDPKVLPSKEVKPLKYNKMDKFANTLEINLDIATNAQIEAAEAIE
jgi:hypothetical protein